MTARTSSFSNVVAPEFTNSGDQNATITGHVVGAGAGRGVSLYDANNVRIGGATCNSLGDFSIVVNVQTITTYHLYTGAITVGADTYGSATSTPFTIKSLRFYDGFDYADAAAMFASGRWAVRQPGYLAVGSGRSYAASDARAVEVSGNQLKLKVLDDPDNPDSDHLLVGHITTGIQNGLQNFTGGHIEASIKFHRFPGAHGCLWHQSGYSAGHAEWDIAEFFGERGNRPIDGTSTLLPQYVKHTVYTQNTVVDSVEETSEVTTGTDEETLLAWTGTHPTNGVYGDDDPQHKDSAFGASAVDYTIWNTFHTYDGYWGSTTYKLAVDGVSAGTIDGYTVDEGVANQPGELILSLLVTDGPVTLDANGNIVAGTDHRLDQGEHGKLKQVLAGGQATLADYVMTVDWVRVWK